MNILITGGASGLGASLVKVLASDNKRQVYFTYSKSAAAAQEIEASYPNTKAFHCDFNDKQSLEGFVQQLVSLGIDALINNAIASINKEHFYKTDPDVSINSFEQNVQPTLRITQEAIKVFRKKKFGKIINIISSYVINKPPAGMSVYVAEKAYLLAMSKAWATEGIKFNITSNSVSPSFMQTGLTADTDERIVEQLTEAHPLKKLLTTQEVAEAVAFLIGSSQQINGTNLVINAGVDLL